MFVIGVDCATDLANVGVATAIVGPDRYALRCVTQVTIEAIALQVTTARQQGHQILLALDAPLGWPKPLGEALVLHRAGEPLDSEAHALFRRSTDRRVQAITGRPPLDVGADRIARTAHASLSLLADVRTSTGHRIPLVWQPTFTEPVGCIEVYPAATLWAHHLPSRGYKGKSSEHAKQRQAIVEQLQSYFELSGAESTVMCASDHSIDAAVCVLAARDFLDGSASTPEDRELAEQEGWIWLRQRRAS